MGGYILVVDDDTALADALKLQLGMHGYEVRTAANGAEALEIVRTQMPMLVLLDLAMPVMNGRKMLQIFRTLPGAAPVPVIVLSAFGFEWEAELMGAQGYIRKPVGTDQLLQEMARVLGSEKPEAPTVRPSRHLLN